MIAASVLLLPSISLGFTYVRTANPHIYNIHISLSCFLNYCTKSYIFLIYTYTNIYYIKILFVTKYTYVNKKSTKILVEHMKNSKILYKKLKPLLLIENIVKYLVVFTCCGYRGTTVSDCNA